MYVMKIEHLMSRGDVLTPVRPSFVKTFDHEVGIGEIPFTHTEDVAEAYVFKDAKEVLETWQRQSKTHPLRPWDRKPNRPLTCLTITVAPLKDFLPSLN